jgi:uncharacterized protein YkwD
VNAERAKQNLPTLALDDRLNVSAQRYATRMATEDFFSHTAPDGETLAERMSAVAYSVKVPGVSGFPPVLNGENIARGYETAAEVVLAWSLSPNHKANMLNPVFRHMGLGFVSGYWVQHFGGAMMGK